MSRLLYNSVAIGAGIIGGLGVASEPGKGLAEGIGAFVYVAVTLRVYAGVIDRPLRPPRESDDRSTWTWRRRPPS